MASSPRSALLGSETPRLFTPPLRKLTRRTSLGYRAITFAEDVLGLTLLPWQKWWLIHVLELNDDGSYRFRIFLTLIGRQNGKTFMLKVLALFLMYEGRVRLILGAAQDLRTARESWQEAIEIARDDPELKAEIDFVRTANGQQEFKLTNGARYLITATTPGAGRGLSVDLLILDELRQQKNWLAYAALSKTTVARPNALIIGISNAGEDDSVVLNSLRENALTGADPLIGIAEWSAPDGCDIDDPRSWAAGMPSMGYPQGVSIPAIRGFSVSDPPQVFRTEILCQHVDVLDTAIDLRAWADCRDASGTLEGLRDRVVACVDVALDGDHVTLAAAASLPDGRVRVETVAAWDSTEAARFELPEVIERVNPRAVAWFPSGPSAAIAPVIRGLQNVVELKGGEAAAVCMGFADLVRARRIMHGDEPLLNAHLAGAKRWDVGEGWRFVRRGVGNVDAAYAAAGAVHAALTIPIKPRVRPRVLVARAAS